MYAIVLGIYWNDLHYKYLRIEIGEQKIMREIYYNRLYVCTVIPTL